MKKNMPLKLYFFIVILAATTTVTTTYAGVILNISGGELTGAEDININGNLYDVTFLNGRCNDLFTGCNDPSDFAFSTEAEALAAGQALLDQVFTDSSLGQFDSNPSLTSGCSDPTVCVSVIGYGFYPLEPDDFFSLRVRNRDSAGIDEVTDPFLNPQSITTDVPKFNWAKFSFVSIAPPNRILLPPTLPPGTSTQSPPPVSTPIPEPSTLLLFAIGILGLACSRKRSPKRQHS